MPKEREIVSPPIKAQEHLSDEPTGNLSSTLPHGGQGSSKCDVASRLKQKPVKPKRAKQPSTAVALVHAKELAMPKASILGKTIHNPLQKLKANTLLNQSLPRITDLKPWRDTDEFEKLAIAALPLYAMSERTGWELKTFTLIFEKNLSLRMDAGEPEAFEYARDQITRGIKQSLGEDAHFSYGIEKAPAALANPKSRNRWHVHGLIVARTGFSKPGKTPLRRALQAIKGEASADLAFDNPGEKQGRSVRESAIRWCVYAGKNGLSVKLDPGLTRNYKLPSGKQTFISAILRQEAKRWHEGKIKGLSERVLREDGPAELY